MFCKNCQKEINNGSNFCMHCGSKIGVADLVRNVLENKQEPKLSRFRRNILNFLKNLILIVCVYVVSALFISTELDKNSQEAIFPLAVPATILVLFVYNKIARRFNL